MTGPTLPGSAHTSKRVRTTLGPHPGILYPLGRSALLPGSQPLGSGTLGTVSLVARLVVLCPSIFLLTTQSFSSWFCNPWAICPPPPALPATGRAGIWFLRLGKLHLLLLIKARRQEPAALPTSALTQARRVTMQPCMSEPGDGGSLSQNHPRCLEAY